MTYSSFHRDYNVILSNDAVINILENIKLAGNLETGGVLLGYYNENFATAIIQSITGPPSDSKSGSTWFERGVNGLRQLFQKLWIKNVYYLGEWHFHPYASASPSTTDIQQMFSIARDKKYNCPEPILLIIGGNTDYYEIRIFVFVKNSKIELKTSGKHIQ